MTFGDIANNFTNAIHLGFLTVSIISFIAAIVLAFKKNAKYAIIAFIVALACYSISEKIPSTGKAELKNQPHQTMLQ